MNPNHYDVIVIGVGSMGSSTCYYLAKNGIKVLGLEQFDIPNQLSSHTGQSRIIRKAYYEHPDYVPLLQRAYDNWMLLERKSGKQVYYKTGLLYAGAPVGDIIQGVKIAAKKHAIEIRLMDHEYLKSWYPAFQIPDQFEILFEPDAGFVRPELAITSYCSLATQLGAELKSNIKVQSWQKTKSGYEVTTSDENYIADKLIFTSGAWASSLLSEWSSKLKVTRQMLAWMNTKNPGQFELGNFPCWMIQEEGSPGVYYGFPVLPNTQFEGPSGFKLAYHYPGEIADPDHLDRTPKEKDEKLLVDFMNRFFPGQYQSTQEMKACMYTNSPDENFILDYLPEHEENVLVATGFSGHGFKFASVIGEIMCDLAIRGKTELPIEFLRASRF
ncbi:MAG TPA: N-methyl-L-tryptophan oxidase [Saprospiraceae bacterium]|nr:N-methyl-L-tryptophan oxidase [Saprospiraceae bacterium]